MQIIIQNLGSIKNNKQAIDLTKKFYVFVGDNNSGKTYVSQLLWTIFNQEVIQKFSKQVDLDLHFENKNIFEITPHLLDTILGAYAKFLKKELAITYNIENTPYQETVLGKFSINFLYDINELELAELQVISNIGVEENKQFEFFILKKEKSSMEVYFEDKDLSDFFENIPKSQKRRIHADRPDLKKSAFVTAIIQLLLNHRHTTLFLPANRTFYPTFYQYIYEIERDKREKDVWELIKLFENRNKKENKVDVKSLNLFKRPYTQPMNHLFERIFDFNKDAEISTHYKFLVEKIADIMGGNVVMSSVEGIAMIDFMFRMNKVEKDLPMYMSSSSVNQLTLLYLYLKYWAEEKGNFLMVDEPEENLNPKNQIKLVEILLAFANQNDNKVLITTHSPILAETVNNYTRLSVIKNKFGINPHDFIENNGLNLLNPNISMASENVGIYFFDGKRIIDYKNYDYAAYFRDFRNVSDAIEGNNRLLTDFIYLKEQKDNG